MAHIPLEGTAHGVRDVRAVRRRGHTLCDRFMPCPPVEGSHFLLRLGQALGWCRAGLCAAGARQGYAADHSSLADRQLSDSCASGATPKVAIPSQIFDSFTPVGPSREYFIAHSPSAGSARPLNVSKVCGG